MVEVLIVLGVFLILVAAAAPSFIESVAFGADETTAEAEDIVQLLATARSNAASNKLNDHWGVHLALDATTDCGLTTAGDCVVIYKGSDFDSRDSSYDIVRVLSEGTSLYESLESTGETGLTYCATGEEIDNPAASDSWFVPGLACALDSFWTNVSLGTGEQSEYAYLSNFGFNVPANAVIDGVIADFYHWGGIAGITDAGLYLVDADETLIGNDQSSESSWPTSQTQLTYGGATDTWGASLTAGIVNDADFGIALAAANCGGCLANQAYIEAMRLNVYYSVYALEDEDFYFNKVSGFARGLSDTTHTTFAIAKNDNSASSTIKIFSDGHAMVVKNYRKKLTFDNSGQSTDLTDFPVLVRLTRDNFDFSKANPDGSDIRFKDPDGTDLSYEIERWEHHEEAILWVKVPQIDAASGADYMYLYDENDDSASDAQNLTDVWSNGYVGVFHMADDPSVIDSFCDDGVNNVCDSSPSANYGTSNGSMTSSDQVSGVMGTGYSFDGDDDYINIDYDASLALTPDVTVTMWINEVSSAYAALLAKTDGSSAWDIDFYHWDGVPNLAFYSDAEGSEVEKSHPGYGAWHFVSFSKSGTNYFFNFDGSETSGSWVSALSNSSLDLRIGRDGAGGEFQGEMDEVRVSDVGRSSDWVQAQYLSQSDQFITYGREEPL